MPRRAFDDPLSGLGAAHHGGRFNRRGLPAFYTALSLGGAVREISRTGFIMQPVLLCCYKVDSSPVFDAISRRLLAGQGISPADLDPPDWRRDRAEGRTPSSWLVADRLIAAGYAGMIVPAFYRGAGPEERNLVLWKWGAELPSRVRLVDDEERLTPR